MIAIIQLCGEKLCIETARVSIAIPGTPQRCYLCSGHFRDLQKAAKEIQLSLEDLDVQILDEAS